MIRIAHISDLHFGFEHRKDKMEKVIRQINEIEPDVVVITGDLTLWGIHEEFKNAEEELSKIESEVFVVPGNHDGRNDGLKYFDLYFGKRKRYMKIDNVALIGVDSTLPDSDDGYIGREQRDWIAERIRGNCIHIIAMHHHVVPVPHTGRNMNVLIDAAEVVEALSIYCRGAIVLAGHRHVPYSTKLLRNHIIHAGTASSYKVLMPDNNYNIIELDESSLRLKLRFVDLGEIEIGKFSIKPETPESIMKYHKLSITKKILFLSRKNSCRSKIAEVLFNSLSPMNMHSVSAGTSPENSVDELARSVMDEMGYALSEPRKLSHEMREDAYYTVSFEEEIDADEHWKLARPRNLEECKKLVKEIEERVRDLIGRLLIL